MTSPTAAEPVQLTMRGPVTPQERSYALRKVSHAARPVGAAVSLTKVVITIDRDPAVESPARIQVGLVVNGRQVRAHAAASDVHQAADLVEDRLRRRLVRAVERTRTRRRRPGAVADHEWRHEDRSRWVSPYRPRPIEERRIAQRKAFALEPLTMTDATYEMDLLDHDFYLYIDAESGLESVVARTADGGCAVLPVEATPVESEADARRRLDMSGEPFAFYRDRDDRKARVIYRRYDGHYGVIAAI